MADTSISANILGKCTFTAGTDASRVDGMTMVNIEPTKFSQLDTIFRDKDNAMWRVVGPMFEAEFRGKACQSKVNGFAEWIKGASKILDPKRMPSSKVKSGLLDIKPYITMEVQNPINNAYWNFTSGTAAAANELTPNLSATFQYKGVVASQKGIPADIRWFGTRTTVTIAGLTGSIKTVASYKVKDAAVVGGSTVIYLDNIGSNAADGLYNLEGTHVKRANIARGLLTRGLPNVTTGEAYCSNIPGLNMKQFKPFWVQQTRRSIKEDDEYLKYVKLIEENNELFKAFGDVDSVEYNRQVMEDYDQLLVDTFFNGAALANQTEATVDQLDKVAWFVGDANSPTYSFEGRYQCRKANAIGFLAQLAECTDDSGSPALIDSLGQVLTLPAMHQKYYDILKVRKARGMDGKVLELWTTSQYREKLVDAYMTFFKNKSSSTLALNMDLTAKENSIGFTWVTINLPWPSVQLRLVSHQALDDYVDAARAAGIAAGDSSGDAATYSKFANLAIVPDWSATYRGVLDSGTVVLESGTAQEIARTDSSMLCGPLVVPQQRVRHYWETFTQVVECGASQVVWENFDSASVTVS